MVQIHHQMWINLFGIEKWVQYYSSDDNNNDNIDNIDMMVIARTSSFFPRLGVDIDVHLRVNEFNGFDWEHFEHSYGFNPTKVKCMFLYPQRTLIAFVPRGKAGVGLQTYQNWRQNVS